MTPGDTIPQHPHPFPTDTHPPGPPHLSTLQVLKDTDSSLGERSLGEKSSAVPGGSAQTEPAAPQASRLFLPEEWLSGASHGEKHEELPATGQSLPRSVPGGWGTPLPREQGGFLPTSLCLPSGNSPDSLPSKRDGERRGR